MLLARSLLAIFVVAFSFCAPVQAVQIEGLYSHQSALIGDDESERAQAFAAALAAVIVKLTGGEEALSVPGVDRALARARVLEARPRLAAPAELVCCISCACV